MMIARVNPYACITFFTLAVEVKISGERRKKNIQVNIFHEPDVLL